MKDGLKGLGEKKPFHVRLPPSLRSTLEASAKLANRSLNAHLGLLLEGSVSDFPVLEAAPAITEPLSKVPFGIRVQDGLKTRIQDAARKCGRSLNTEIVIRLLLAAGAVRSIVEVMPRTAEGRIEADMSAAWYRLSQAIESMLCASVTELSKAAVEVRAAKAEYEQLVHLKNLALHASATSEI